MWWKVLLSYLRQADNTLRGALSALACLLRGTDPTLLTCLPLREVCEALVVEDIAHSILPEVKWQLLRCVEAVLEFASDEDVSLIFLRLFFLL